MQDICKIQIKFNCYFSYTCQCRSWISITDLDDPLAYMVILVKPRFNPASSNKVEACTETYISCMNNWFCVMAKITWKSKIKVDVG